MVARLLFTLMLLVGVCVAPPMARAQDASSPDAARARELFESGVAMSQQERWTEALAAFRESAALVERPNTILNIATALQRLGRARECIEAVDRYLAISSPETDAANRSRASELRATMEASLAHVALAVLPADSQLEVDGELVTATGAERNLVLDPGMHSFQVSHEGFLPSRFAIDFSPGQQLSRAISLTARPAQPARLEVSTQVVGAQIWVDGEIVGLDEVDMELVPGSHVVRVTAAGDWQPFERTLTIEAGTRQRVDAQLSHEGSCQSVECEPAFWVVLGLIVAGGAAAGIALPYALASEGPAYGGTANFTVDALRF